MNQPILDHIAQRAGVSVATVSRVLNGRQKENRPTAQARSAQIRAIAAELGYRPDAAARAVRLNRHGHIGLLFWAVRRTEAQHPLLFELVEGINAGLEASGHMLTMVRLGDIADRGVTAARSFRERMFDGLIIAGHVPEACLDTVAAMSPNTIHVDADRWQEFCCVRRDERAAGRLAARALAAAGCARVTVLARAVYASHFIHYSHADRLAGIREEIACELVEVSTEQPWPDLAALLRGQDGVVLTDGYLAMQFLAACATQGVRPGRDIAVTCCDDHSLLSKMWADLSRASFDRFAMGRAAAAMMLAVLEGDAAGSRSHILPTTWIPGSTCPGAVTETRTTT